jgi:FlaA1/EpsC-like NDP-sugar epimerase
MTILITGAAGSIGSEIARKLIGNRLILFDINEYGLYELDNELREDYNFSNFVLYLGNICNPNDINYVTLKHKPEVVYHAAAYKHIHLLEADPRAAFTNNVWGTKVVVDICRCKKFVYVSTDKAVNPTSVMGATKRIAEMYVQSKSNKTKYITTRFGNVMNSSGSVIPRWKRQLEKGQPLTVTHPDMERYFMTVDEAAELVINAYLMGTNGDIFTWDMGRLQRLADLAMTMSDNIVYTGLRPGERLYEELLNGKEKNHRTKHEKIFKAKAGKIDEPWINWAIGSIKEGIYQKTDEQIVQQMKEVLYPDYQSANSKYEYLDEVTEKKIQDAKDKATKETEG